MFTAEELSRLRLITIGMKEQEPKSSRLDQGEVEEIKISRGFLHEGDNTLFIKYRDPEGAERSCHWMKMRGAVRKNSKTGLAIELPDDIDRVKRELEAKGCTIIQPQ